MFLQGLVIAMVGYCMIGLCLVVLHALASILGLRRSARALGLCYVVVKVRKKKNRVADPVGSGPFWSDPENFHWIRFRIWILSVLWQCKVV